MIIALQPKQPAAEQLSALCVAIRKLRRGEGPPNEAFLAEALNLTETSHGHQTATYVLLPGATDNEGGLATYRLLKSDYPAVLDLMCMAADQGAREVTIEVGTLNRRDQVQYSHHNLLQIVPRIIAGFRGYERGT